MSSSRQEKIHQALLARLFPKEEEEPIKRESSIPKQQFVFETSSQLPDEDFESLDYFIKNKETLINAHKQRIQKLTKKIETKQEEEQSSSESEEESKSEQTDKQEQSTNPLSKNKRRKLKKKRRRKELIEQGVQVPSKRKKVIDKPKEEENVSIEQNKYFKILEKHKGITDAPKEVEVEEFFEDILILMLEDASDSDATEQKRATETSKFCKRFFELLKKRKIQKETLKQLISIKHKLVFQQWDEADQIYFQLSLPSKKTDSSSWTEEEKLDILQAIKRLMTFWQSKFVEKRKMN